MPRGRPTHYPRSCSIRGGSMLRHMEILGIPVPQPSISSDPRPSVSNSCKPGGIRIVKEDAIKHKELDVGSLMVQLAWSFDGDHSSGIKASVRETIQNILAKPDFKFYSCTDTMERVVRDCEKRFEPDIVKLALFANGSAVDDHDTFSQLVSARRLLVFCSDSDAKYYILEVRLQEPTDSASSSGIAADAVDLVDHGPDYKRENPTSMQQVMGEKKALVEGQPPDGAIHVQVKSLQELFALLPATAIKKMTILLDLDDGEKLVITGNT